MRRIVVCYPAAVNGGGGGGELAEIRAEHRAGTVGRVAVLDRAALAIGEGTLSDVLRDAARREAHTLAGSLAIFGFMDASRIARDLKERYRVRPPVADALTLAELAAVLRLAIDQPMSGPVG